MLKAALTPLTHIVQQNKHNIKLGQLQPNQGHKQPFYLLKRSGNYFYRACLLNLPCFIMAFRNPFRSAVILF